MIPKYRAIYTGNGFFTGNAWQVYRHEPDGDTEKTLNYINHTPNILYKTEEACQKKCDELTAELKGATT